MPSSIATDPITASRLRLERPLVLVGLMGAGKTSIGRRVAQRLGIPFADADAEIEHAANASIAEIFERDGEAAFRSGERRVILRLLDGDVGVLSTGGGAFMDPETRARIHERAISLWLKADLETLVQRTSRRTHRPMLAGGDHRAILGRLMAERHPTYAEADLIVESQAGPADATVRLVLDSLIDLADAKGVVRPLRDLS